MGAFHNLNLMLHILTVLLYYFHRKQNLRPFSAEVVEVWSGS